MSSFFDNQDLEMVKEFRQAHNNTTIANIADMESWAPAHKPVESWMEFLDSKWDHKLKTFKLAGFTDVAGLPQLKLKSIGVEFVNKAIEVEGKVIAMSERQPSRDNIIFKCDNCGHKHVLPIRGNGHKPRKCEQCKERELTEVDYDETTLVDSQAIKIQEIRSAGGNSKHASSTMTTLVKGKELIWVAHPGQKVRQRGIFRASPYIVRDGSERWRQTIEVFAMDVLDSTEIKLTPEDIEKIKQWANEPQYYEKVVASFAPHIYGLDEAKEACVLALASQGLDRPLNVMLAGDPDTGKSELMWYAVDISHNGHKTDMASSSQVGLTVESAYDEDTGRRIASPGLLNFADGGIAGIDELQAIKPEDAKKLNGVLESKEIASAKAGVHEQFPARTAIIMTTNSEFGRWDAGTNILENLKYLGAARAMIVSRLDLILIIKDAQNEELDKQKSQKIIKTYGKVEKPKSLFMEDTDERFGYYTMQKIFAYITRQPLPEVPDELHEQFQQVYLDARRADYNSMVGNRYFKSVIRLARIVARLLLKATVTIEDLQRAKHLIDKSNDAAAFDPRTQAVDVQIINGTGRPQVEVEMKRNKEEQFWDGYQHAIANNDNQYATLSDLISAMSLYHRWDETKTRRFVEALYRAARLYEPHGQGKYTKNERL